MATRIDIPIDEIKKAAKAEKEKQKGKHWKNVSSKDKDYIAFMLAKAGGFVADDMKFE